MGRLVDIVIRATLAVSSLFMGLLGFALAYNAPGLIEAGLCIMLSALCGVVLLLVCAIR